MMSYRYECRYAPIPGAGTATGAVVDKAPTSVESSVECTNTWVCRVKREVLVPIDTRQRLVEWTDTISIVLSTLH